MPEQVEVMSGQTWRRKRDGQETVVKSVEPQWSAIRYVAHQGKRHTFTEYGPFLRKYEYVKGGDHE